MLGFRALLIGVLASGLAACIGMGPQNTRPASGSLVLSETTITEAERIIGNKGSRAPMVKSPEPFVVFYLEGDNPAGIRTAFRHDPAEGSNIETLTYLHFNPLNASGGKSFALYFWNGKLVMHKFVSNREADSTDFNVARVSEIHLGRSTRTDIVRVLGEPSGEAIYPMIRSRDGRAIIYKFFEQDSTRRVYIDKLAIFQLDGGGVVRDQQIRVREVRYRGNHAWIPR